MKKSVLFAVIGSSAIILWVFVLYLYINKVANDDFNSFLTANSLAKSVYYKKLSRNLFGSYKIENMKLENIPYKSFSFTVKRIEVSGLGKSGNTQKISMEFTGINFDIHKYLQSKNMSKNDVWKIARNFDIEKDFYKNMAFSFASLGIKRIENVKAVIDMVYNKEESSAFIKVDLKMPSVADVIFSVRFDNAPYDMAKNIIDVIKNPDTDSLSPNIMVENLQFIIKDNGFMKKLFNHQMTYSYDDDTDENADMLNYSKTNILSEKLNNAGFSRQSSDEFARNIADFYNDKTKLSIISDFKEKISLNNIKEARNFFDFLYITDSKIYVLSNPVTKTISIND